MKNYILAGLLLALLVVTPTFASATAIPAGILENIAQKVKIIADQIEFLKTEILALQNGTSAEVSGSPALSAITETATSAVSEVLPAVVIETPNAVSGGSSVAETSSVSSDNNAENSNSAAIQTPAIAQSAPQTSEATSLIVGLLITTPVQIIGANVPSEILTAQSQNESGAAEKASDIIKLSFQSSSATGLFSSGNATTGICTGSFTDSPNINISTGSANRSFCYKDSTPGTYAITVSATDHPDWTSATKEITVLKPGDANADGAIDELDYQKIDNGFKNKLTGWENGDFNADGIINADDYFIIDSAYILFGGPVKPKSPSVLTASATSGRTIVLNWTDNSDNEDGFEVERKTGDSSFEKIDTVESDIISYNDKDLTPKTSYTYRVRSSNGGVFSDYTNESSATTWIMGDANGDSLVNDLDYEKIDNGFKNQLPGWENGDFNGDGVINADDYFIIDSQFILTGQGSEEASAD